MKVYKFYKSPSDEVLAGAGDLSIEDKYPLYAMTSNKEYASEFRTSRNMDKFIEIVSDIDKSDWVDIANKFNGNLLKYYKYDTLKKYTDEPKPKMKEIEVLSTWHEREWVGQYSDDFMIDLIRNKISKSVTPFIIKDKYRSALDTLQYTSFWKFMIGINRAIDIMTAEEECEHGDFVPPMCEIDKFSLFLYLFGDTFR